MTTPASIEDRLRAYYAELADDLQLPSRELDDVLLVAQAWPRHDHVRRRWAVAVAAAIVLAAVFGALAVLPRSQGARPTATTQTTAAPTIVVQPTPTTADPNHIDPEPELMPYTIDLPGTISQLNVGYPDPATGAIGATFVSKDGSLSQMITVLRYPLSSKQLPKPATGDTISVPTGSARWFADTGRPSYRVLRWQLADSVLTVSSFRVDAAATIGAAIEFEQAGAISSMQFDGVYGFDQAETALIVDPVPPVTTSSSSPSAEPPTSATLTFAWYPKTFEMLDGSASVKTTVLGQPAWRTVVRG